MTQRFHNRGQWPKELPELTEEQQRIREDFYGFWLSQLPERYSLVERFNHRYPLRSCNEVKPPIRTLDIGAGRGTHIPFEDLDKQEYTALELREELAKEFREKYPSVRIVIGNIQERVDFPNGYFNRILAIHLLEHLTHLPQALDEIRRLLSPDGRFSVLIPCDPGAAYQLARNLSAKRMFEDRYMQSYDWFVACEHINTPAEIMQQLESRFEIVHRVYFPLMLPVVTTNLIIGLTLKYRKADET
jgi:SAM-dependent methyltransferase